MENSWEVLLSDRDGNERREGPFPLKVALLVYREYEGCYPTVFLCNAETGESYF